MPGKRLVYQIENGTAGIVPCGTTGESATLTQAEHVEVIGACVKAVRGRAKVIAGTGSNSTAEAIELTRAAKELGADAALLITPYYNKPPQQGLYDHYRAIAEAVDIPLVVYNCPGRTGVSITPQTPSSVASATWRHSRRRSDPESNARCKTAAKRSPMRPMQPRSVC